MKPNFMYLLLALCQIISIVDVRQHNKTVEDLFQDPDDQKQIHYRLKLTIPLYGYYFFLILIVGLFINSCFE